MSPHDYLLPPCFWAQQRLTPWGVAAALKDSVAVSQAAVAGGSLAGVVCGLLAQALSSSGLGADFGLALQYGPLLFLGTSGGALR